MRRSIRWTLLGWYGLILCGVIAAFGGLLAAHRQRTVTERIDAELAAYANAIAGAVELDPQDGLEVDLTDDQRKRLAASGAYYLVWNREGRVLECSASAPRIDAPPAGWRERGTLREVALPAAEGTRVLVGRDTAAARQELAAFDRTVARLGLVVLIFSFAGGWFLVGRVLAPIDRMTRTAARIDAGNRSERIDVGRTESELGRLAATLNQAFDRLDDAYERQTRFTADASHELRTPLSIVRTGAELALRRERTAEEYREALLTVLRGAERMSGVVDGLLTLARSDAGELELVRAPADLARIAREVVEFLQPLAAERDVTLFLEAGEAPLQGDPDRLRDAVANLVSNAIRYNTAGGRVDVAVAAADGHVRLSVADSGIGIPADALPRVFDRFYRVDPARSREAGGNGLGLAITRWIVEAHGGQIVLESEPGRGTTATVRLPA